MKKVLHAVQVPVRYAIDTRAEQKHISTYPSADFPVSMSYIFQTKWLLIDFLMRTEKLEKPEKRKQPEDTAGISLPKT